MKRTCVDVTTSRQRLDGINGEWRHPQLAARPRRQLAQGKAERVFVPDLLLAESANQEEWKVAQPSSDDMQEIERRVIGPMQVLEHDHRPRPAAPQDRQKHLENVVSVAFRERRLQRPTASCGNVRQRRERPGRDDPIARPPERFSLCSVTAEGFDETRLADTGFAGDKQQATVLPSGVLMLSHPSEQRLAFQEPHSPMVRPWAQRALTPSYHLRPGSPALS